MSYSSGISLSDAVLGGCGRDVVTLKLGFFRRKSENFFSNSYFLAGFEKEIMANGLNCLVFDLGVITFVLYAVEGEVCWLTKLCMHSTFSGWLSDWKLFDVFSLIRLILWSLITFSTWW